MPSEEKYRVSRNCLLLSLLIFASCSGNSRSSAPSAGAAVGAQDAANADSPHGTSPSANSPSAANSGAAGTRQAPGQRAGAVPASAAGPGASAAQGQTPGTSPGNSGADFGADEGPDPTPLDTAGPVLVETTPGKWRTALDPSTGRFHFLDPNDMPAVLRGISLTGTETGTRETASGAGFWLFLSNQMPEAQNAPTVLKNVVDTLTAQWKARIVRIPICGSAWTQNYQVHDWGNDPIAGYRDWVDLAVKEARARGAVVIIDNHLWAIAKAGSAGVDRGTFESNGETHKYAEFEDGCTGVNKVMGVDSCAPSDWYTQDTATWQCAIANADGVTLHNAYLNKAKISSMWADIATRYKDDDGVWFELYNEPYTRQAARSFPGVGDNQAEKDYPWDLWTAYMLEQIQSIRDTAKATNIILVNGLDWGYDFGPKYGAIAYPDKYLPWKTQYSNIAYAFHPYQHGACCGAIGASGTDQSATDPYESAFCSYYSDGSAWGAPSNTPLPGGKTCSNKGYAATQDKKMPPCTWVASGWNPNTQGMGLCAGDRVLCGSKTQAECEASDWSSPAAGGWSRYVLPMAKYGPLIATEFGSFDCSSAYVNTLLQFMNRFDISYTAWALWPQNSGGPEGLGSCGYPSVMTPISEMADFRQCLDPAGCQGIMQPLPWSGQATYQDLMSH